MKNRSKMGVVFAVMAGSMMVIPSAPVATADTLDPVTVEIKQAFFDWFANGGDYTSFFEFLFDPESPGVFDRAVLADKSRFCRVGSSLGDFLFDEEIDGYAGRENGSESPIVMLLGLEVLGIPVEQFVSLVGNPASYPLVVTLTLVDDDVQVSPCTGTRFTVTFTAPSRPWIDLPDDYLERLLERVEDVGLPDTR